MTADQKSTIAGYGYMFIAFGLAPILAVHLRNRKKKDRKWIYPILIAVIVSWVFQILYRDMIDLPISIQRAREKGDLMYDGVGGNTAVFMMGWIFPLFTCGLLWISWRIYESIQKRKKGA